MIYELIYNEKYGELSEEDINNIPDDSNIKADVRQIIGNPSITNNDNILPAADDGIDNENGENKILAIGNAAAPALNFTISSDGGNENRNRKFIIKCESTKHDVRK